MQKNSIQHRATKGGVAGIVLVCILLGGTYVVIDRQEATVGKEDKHATHIVRVTDTAFVPAELHVRWGDTVQFITERGTAFWPASDLHPIHEDYPDFDARRPIPPNESWTFTFTQKGSWSYHNHLHPFFRGRIVVE